MELSKLTENNKSSENRAASNWQNLKVVFIMTRSLNAQMEPINSLANDNDPTSRWFVNSNLISISLVADPQQFKSQASAQGPALQVSLASPFELVFKHQDIAPLGWNSRHSLRPNKCVFWEATNSDWLQNGCRLVETNRTHSICACNHLTTFGLLTEWDPTQSTTSSNPNPLINELVVGDGNLIRNNNGIMVNGQVSRVQLESIENEFHFSPIQQNNNRNNNNRMLYLAKMLDGQLFGTTTAAAPIIDTPYTSQPNQTNYNGNIRLLIGLSCLISALLLALATAASLYDRAHTSRLLASIPLRTAPSLLVTRNSTGPTSGSESVADLSPVSYGQEAGSSTGTSATTTGNGQSSSGQIWHCQPIYQAAPLIGAAAHSNWKFHNDNSIIVIDNKQLELKVPIYLLLQLFIMQLLVMILMASQNWFAPHRKSSMMMQESPIPTAQLAPIGQITWFLIILLYYLITSFGCWLLSQFLQLNFSLIEMHNKIKKVVIAGSSMNAPRRQLANSGSNSASSDNNDPSRSQSDTYKQYGATTRQYGSDSDDYNMGYNAVYGKNTEGSGKKIYKMSQIFIKHLLPILLTIIYFSISSNDWMVIQLNEMTYVTGLASQAACWPLLIDISWFNITFSISLTGSICGFLFTFALWSLRNNGGESASRASRMINWSTISNDQYQHQQQPQQNSAGDSRPRPAANPYGSSAFELTRNPFVLGSNGSKQSTSNGIHLHSNSNSNSIGLNCDDVLIEKWQNGCSFDSPKPFTGTKSGPKVKLPKLSGAILLALLVLHSICWLTFMIHIKNMLENSSTSGSGLNGFVYPISISHTSQSQWVSYKLLYSFSICNLIIVCLICWCKKRHLVRASQLLGLKRLINFCFGTNNGGNSPLTGCKSEHHLANGFYDTTTSAPISAQNGTKISPSTQSLFMISDQQQLKQYGQTGSNYLTSNYGVSNQQQQQHLYQPIYNDPSDHRGPQMGTLGYNNNRMSLQQQQQQQSYTLNRNPNHLMMLDARQSLKQQQQHENQFYQANNNSRTLGYHHQRALVMDQIHVPGEVEGPLVALGNGNSTSGASSTSSSQGSSSNQQPVGMKHQQQATFGPNQQQHQNIQYEPHLFNSGSQNQDLRMQQQGANFRFANNQQAYNNQTTIGNHDQLPSAIHFRRPSQQLMQQQQFIQRQMMQQQMNHRSSSTEDESGHIYDTAQNCYSSFVQ